MDADDLSDKEKKARISLIALCCLIAESHEYELFLKAKKSPIVKRAGNNRIDGT